MTGLTLGNPVTLLIIELLFFVVDAEFCCAQPSLPLLSYTIQNLFHESI